MRHNMLSIFLTLPAFALSASLASRMDLGENFVQKDTHHESQVCSGHFDHAKVKWVLDVPNVKCWDTRSFRLHLLGYGCSPTDEFFSYANQSVTGSFSSSKLCSHIDVSKSFQKTACGSAPPCLSPWEQPSDANNGKAQPPSVLSLVVASILIPLVMA